MGARPAEHKKGADQGIDGRLIFSDGSERQEIILSVKAGHVTSAHVDQLRGVVEKEQAAMGALLTMHAPTGPMRAAAAKAGFYESPWGKHPKIQILTAEELLAGARLDMPPIAQVNLTYKRGPKSLGKSGAQGELL